jgi:tetratricopeptide (TPR) repeat protein
MSRKSLPHRARWALLSVSLAVTGFAQNSDSNDIQGLLQAGNAALSQNRFADAARAFQKVIDLNPSSAKGHEGLGLALSSRIISGNVRPSDDAEAIERAENHLKQAAQLSPSASAPLRRLADLEAALAARTSDPAEKAERYTQAQGALKQIIALEPSNPKVYLQLANLERDEFGPPIQQAQARMGQQKGPLSDAGLRAALRRDYGKLIDDAISNAQQATNMNANDPKPLFLLSRLYRERAVLRDTADEYATDMRKAADWQRQFLAVGGHLESQANR